MITYKTMSGKTVEVESEHEHDNFYDGRLYTNRKTPFYRNGKRVPEPKIFLTNERFYIKYGKEEKDLNATIMLSRPENHYQGRNEYDIKTDAYFNEAVGCYDKIKSAEQAREQLKYRLIKEQMDIDFKADLKPLPPVKPKTTPFESRNDATRNQTWALFLITGYDWRKFSRKLDKKQASTLITAGNNLKNG